MAKEENTDKERGCRIKYVRKNLLGIKSQEEFAKLIGGEGVTRGAVCNWERGGPIKLSNLTAICEVAGIDLQWLAYNTGPSPEDKRSPSEEKEKNKLLNEIILSVKNLEVEQLQMIVNLSSALLVKQQIENSQGQSNRAHISLQVTPIPYPDNICPIEEAQTRKQARKK